MQLLLKSPELDFHRTSRSFHQRKEDIVSTKFRRSSCCCTECSSSGTKTLPGQDEIAMHKTMRLTHLFLLQLEQKNKKTQMIKNQFRLHAKSSQFKLRRESHNLQNLEPIAVKNTSSAPTRRISHNKPKLYYLMNMKKDFNRREKTLNNLIKGKRIKTEESRTPISQQEGVKSLNIIYEEDSSLQKQKQSPYHEVLPQINRIK